MRDYGIISTAFWIDEKMQSASDPARLLALYFLAGPHSNIAGVMRIPELYIADDLKWDASKVKKTLTELISLGFINRCGNSSWTLVKRYLSYNRPENPNQWKAVDRLVVTIPQHIRQALEIQRWFKPFAKQLPNTFEIQEQEQEQEQDISLLTEARVSEREPDLILIPDLPKTPDHGPDAVRMWNALATECGLSLVKHVTTRRKQSLRLRLEECGGIDGWKAAMEKVRDSAFLRGDPGPWKADFDFVLQASSFTKLMEGSYDPNGLSSSPSTGRRPGKPTSDERIAALYGASPDPGQPGSDGPRGPRPAPAYGGG